MRGGMEQGLLHAAEARMVASPSSPSSAARRRAVARHAATHTGSSVRGALIRAALLLPSRLHRRPSTPRARSVRARTVAVMVAKAAAAPAAAAALPFGAPARRRVGWDQRREDLILYRPYSAGNPVRATSATIPSLFTVPEYLVQRFSATPVLEGGVPGALAHPVRTTAIFLLHWYWRVAYRLL